MTTHNEEMTGLKGELRDIEGEIAKLEDSLRPLLERRNEINNRLATMEEEGDDLAKVVGILEKYSVEEIEAAINRKISAKLAAYNK